MKKWNNTTALWDRSAGLRSRMFSCIEIIKCLVNFFFLDSLCEIDSLHWITLMSTIRGGSDTEDSSIGHSHYIYVAVIVDGA